MRERRRERRQDRADLDVATRSNGPFEDVENARHEQRDTPRSARVQVPRRMPSDRSTACEGGPALPAYFLVSVFRVHEPSFDPTTSSARFPEKECPEFG